MKCWKIDKIFLHFTKRLFFINVRIEATRQLGFHKFIFMFIFTSFLITKHGLVKRSLRVIQILLFMCRLIERTVKIKGAQQVNVPIKYAAGPPNRYDAIKYNICQIKRLKISLNLVLRLCIYFTSTCSLFNSKLFNNPMNIEYQPLPEVPMVTIMIKILLILTQLMKSGT